MKLMPCPMNGMRPIAEFLCRGPVSSMPDMEKGSERAWAEYLFLQDTPLGLVDEWWMHTPTGFWFVVRRNTEDDRIVKTWTMQRYAKERSKK